MDILLVVKYFCKYILRISGVADVSTVAEVVGLTIADFVPRQAIRLQHVLRNFPLI